MDTAREPLLTRGVVVSAVGALVVILGWFGVSVTDTFSDELVEVTLALTVVAGPLVHAWWSRPHVTPAKDPRAADGTPLVPAGSLPILDGTGAVAAVVVPPELDPNPGATP